MHRRSVLAAIAIVIALGVIPAIGRAAPAAPDISASTQAAFRSIAGHRGVQQALTFLQRDHEATLADQKAIVAIPAPPFKEKVRAESYLKRLGELGLVNAGMDAEGNVCGTRPGRGGGPLLLLEAHLDTVFPEGTTVTPVERDGRLYAPGIADNTRGLAALLSILRALRATGIRTGGDLLVCGTVGEEGLGDLRGMKALFKTQPAIAGSVSLDGTGASHITHLATGSKRYEVVYRGPGGHSYGAFGLPSAIHAMGRAIARIAEIQTPLLPRTTFTVGTVAGGTSVNSIAADATMQIDLRSSGPEELARLVERVMPLLQRAAEDENARWKSDQLRVETRLIGDRPAGTQPADAIVVQAAWMAARSIGQQPRLTEADSTNANWPISLGIPAVTIGGGGRGGRNHALDEWFDPRDAHLGPQRALLTVVGLLGIDGVTPPLLPPAPRRP